MIAGVRAVNTSRADLGIVVDTDVDRSAVVAGNGTPINSNRYIALMSYITLRSAWPCATCPMTSLAQLLSGLQRLWLVSYMPGAYMPWDWTSDECLQGSHGMPLLSQFWLCQVVQRCRYACRKYPGTTIVTDSVTSNGLTEFIDSLGGKHFRYKRGYKNVIGKGVELNEQGVQTELMMETRQALRLPFRYDVMQSG